MIVESSSDILNLVLAASALLVAVFFSYFLYGLIKIIQDIRDISKLTREKLELIDAVLTGIKEKLAHSATYFGILVNLVEKYISHQREKKTSSSSTDTPPSSSGTEAS